MDRAFKGTWSSDTIYELNDVVTHFGEAYALTDSFGSIGIPPTNNKYWGRLSTCIEESVLLMADIVAMVEAKIPSNITAKTVRLESSTAGSTKLFDITVDDDGEITATEVV